MASSFLSTFLDYGFKDEFGDRSKLVLALFDDFTVIATCEEDWAEEDFITLYINADGFAPIIESIFLNSRYAEEVQPRKLRDDKSGCLCMVSTCVERVDGDWSIWLNGEEIRLKDLLQAFSDSKSIDSFYESIYINRNLFFVWIETIWVYLFLNRRNGVTSPIELYQDIKNEKMRAIVKRWNLKTELSEEGILEIQNSQYNTLQ